MGLFTKKKKVNPILANPKANSMGDDLTKLNSDGELPFGWVAHNKQYVEPYESKMTSMAVSLKNYKGTDRIQPLKELITYYDEYKKFCYNKNECFKKYFIDMWEHCHNSRCDDFEYIAPYVEELKNLEKK